MVWLKVVELLSGFVEGCEELGSLVEGCEGVRQFG